MDLRSSRESGESHADRLVALEHLDVREIGNQLVALKHQLLDSVLDDSTWDG